jgi:GT2 family glycosyltransferase
VPTRDTCDLTLKCLAAIAQAETSGPCEVVVVDDGSQDGTAVRVRSDFPDVRIVRHDTSRGFTESANAGLRAATGSLLLLLNSDTEVRPDALLALTDAFDRDPALGIAGAQLFNSDGSVQWSGGRDPDRLWLFAEASGLARQLARLPGYRRAHPLAHATDRDVAWVSGAALAMRRTVWQHIGPLDESFRLYAQDLDFCIRAGEAGWNVRIVSRCAVLHHQGATIGKVSPTVNRHHTAYLWADLLRWSAKQHGAAYARHATVIVSMGARLRLLGRRIVAPFLLGDRRTRWSTETREIGAALDVLRGAAL